MDVHVWGQYSIPAPGATEDEASRVLSGAYQGAGVHAARVDTAQRQDAAGGVHGEVGREDVLGDGAGGPQAADEGRKRNTCRRRKGLQQEAAPCKSSLTGHPSWPSTHAAGSYISRQPTDVCGSGEAIA